MLRHKQKFEDFSDAALGFWSSAAPVTLSSGIVGTILAGIYPNTGVMERDNNRFLAVRYVRLRLTLPTLASSISFDHRGATHMDVRLLDASGDLIASETIPAAATGWRRHALTAPSGTLVATVELSNDHETYVDVDNIRWVTP